MKERLEFIINSQDRVSGTSSDYTIQLRDYIRLPSGKFPTKCKVIGINFTNGLNNVNANNNTIVIFETGATSNTTITLPIGTYNASQLATQLQTSFNAATQVANTYTVTYSTYTYGFTITANTHTFAFVGTYILLGMLNNTTASLTQTSSQGAKLLFDFVVVKTDIIGNYVTSNRSNNYGSFIIPLGSCDLGTTTYIGRQNLPEVKRVFFPNLNNFHVSIYDQYGNLVNLNNFDHQITLEIYE